MRPLHFPLAIGLALAPLAAAETPLQPSNLAHVLGVTDSARAMARVPTSMVRPNVAWSVLAAKVPGPVDLRVRVDRDGIVDSVQVVKGDPRLASAAIDAARWCLYAPTGIAEWTDLRIAFPALGDAEELSPDPVTMALAAEERGDLQEAVDAWTGALARVGRHPSLQDDHAIRAHILTLARRMTPPPAIPNLAAGPARGAMNRLQRSMASVVSRELLTVFDQSLAIAPWFADAYRWRAAALAGCGRPDDARRAVMLYRLASADSSSRALADRALRALANADSIGASQMLKF